MKVTIAAIDYIISHFDRWVTMALWV